LRRRDRSKITDWIGEKKASSQTRSILALMRYAIFSLAVLSISSITTAADWLTLPSTYSHDASGARVSQYAPIEAPQVPIAANFRSSGYTHTRSSLNYGPSSDNYHRVEEWGDQVRPYGEWRFPYRPYSTPYPNWGPPLAGFNSGFGNPGFGGGFGGGFGAGFGGGLGYRGGKGPERPHDGDDSDHSDWRRFPKRGDYERGYLGGGRWPSDRDRNQAFPGPQASPFNPYPAGPGTPYPVAPYYDGYYPSYRN
jgi:hypothetical protein